jgi:hypothetical protein
MSQNTATLGERFNEIAATAALTQLSKRLYELATEPSTKRWTRNRAAAAESWIELRELAATRAAAAAKSTETKRPVGRPPRTSTSVPIKTAAPSETAAAANVT